MRIAFLAFLICVVVLTAANGHRFGKTGWGPHRPERHRYFDKWRTTTKYKCDDEEKFKEIRNWPNYLNGLQIISKVIVEYSSPCRCSRECLKKRECGAFVLREKYCILLLTRPWGKKPYIYARGDRFFAYIGINLIVLLYRVQSGVDGDPIAIYNDNSYVSSDADTVLAVDLTTTLNATYKSALLDYWNYFNIVTVGIGFLNPGEDSKLIVFDGRDSTNKYDWMDQKKLLSSPWSDLTPTSNTSNFGVFGTGTRRFNIMDHRGCSGDLLWMSVVTKDSCGWAAGYNDPEIIYSPLSTAYPVNDGLTCTSCSHLWSLTSITVVCLFFWIIRLLLCAPAT